MRRYIIQGGNPLYGEVPISGAKNAALPILAAAVMASDPVTIENLPDVSDVENMLEGIQALGARVIRANKHTVIIDGTKITSCKVGYENARKIRASYYLIGALLGKFKYAEVPLPGGCNIGSRPIDQHIKGFRRIGAEVSIVNGDVVAKSRRLKGAHLFLDVVSVGATINIMIAAAMSHGDTIIENVAKEPHVVDVANFLNHMGANIRGAGTDVIRIRGVNRLHGCTYAVIPDMIEAGTYMLAPVVTGGDVIVNNIIPKHVESISAKLCEIGCSVAVYDDAIRVVSHGRTHKTNIKTLPYPGFPTDMQPQMSVALALSEGTSIVNEGIFENRFRYADELVKMGAKITINGTTAIIDGVEKFSSARLVAPDLRAGAALVLAGLNAKGMTIIEDIEYIERGYERIDEKLRDIGANIVCGAEIHDYRELVSNTAH